MAYIPLRPPKAPNIPLGPVDYSQKYIDQLNNAFRLYFNQIDNSMFGLLDTDGGRFLGFPHIAVSDNTDQLATASNTPTVVAWNTLNSGSGFTLAAPGTATAEVSGVYKIAYGLQLANTDNAAHDAAIWLKIDTGSGFVDVPNSTVIFTLPPRKSAGVPSYLLAFSEIVFSINAGDKIELYWATNQAYDTSPATDGVYIEHLPVQTVPYARPAVPSAIGSITFISRLPTTP
jgi:hypothetical protein